MTSLARLGRFTRPLGWAFVPLAAGALLWACSDDTATSDGGPCATTFKDECGKPCDGDGDCASGLYCDASGHCHAECTPGGSECPSGECSPHGRCGAGEGGSGGAGGSGGVGGSILTGGAGNDGGAGAAGGSCGTVEVEFAPQIPTVVMLIDQSGSMDQDFNGQTRWDAVYDALMDPVDGVVTNLEAEVRFGLALYTYTSGPVCPELITQLPPAQNAYAAIDAVYGPETWKSNTPTGDSITAITPGLDSFPEPGPKLIILATDGEPDRCEDPDGHDQISRDEATAAAQAAYALGIRTVIIAVGNQVSQTHQQDMANAGAGLPVPAANPCVDPMQCAPTYEPATKQQLITDLTNIINGQRTCVFDLDGEVIPGKECDGEVRVNMQILPCNDPNGWQLNGPTQIEFVGDACTTILNDENVIIEATFPCDAVTTGTGTPK